MKVLDFGLAKLTESHPSTDATLTAAPKTEEGTVMGTAAYVSPEQAEGKQVDARSDIFRFGALLFEMLTGHRAFQRDSRTATLAAVLREEPKAIGELNPANWKSWSTVAFARIRTAAPRDTMCRGRGLANFLNYRRPLSDGRGSVTEPCRLTSATAAARTATPPPGSASPRPLPPPARMAIPRCRSKRPPNSTSPPSSPR